MENLGIKLMNTLNPKTDQHKFPPYNIKTYCMATIVRRFDWLLSGHYVLVMTEHY